MLVSILNDDNALSTVPDISLKLVITVEGTPHHQLRLLYFMAHRIVLLLIT